MRAVISAEGMNPATFLKSAGITALAKKMEQLDRDAERTKYLDELQRGEQRLYDLVRDYVNAVRGAELLPPARVEIEFREPVVPADPLHDAQALQLQKELGLIGLVRARAKMDGISLDEALRRMQQDREMDERFLQVDAMPAANDAIDIDAGDEAEAMEGAEAVQDLALNGAQVASLLQMVQAVSLRTLAPEAARLMIQAAFPAIPLAQVNTMVESSASFTTAPEAVAEVLP
jgi:hypothetical protein